MEKVHGLKICILMKKIGFWEPLGVFGHEEVPRCHSPFLSMASLHIRFTHKASARGPLSP